MYTNAIAMAGLFAALASAIPMAAHQKRDIVWVTEIEEDIVTVPVTVTVWVEPTPTHYGHLHGAHRPSTTVVPNVPVASAAAPPPAAVAPAPSSETSSYVAPASTTTTSAYVAPTTTTSVYVAPETTTSAWVAPTTSVYVAPTTTTTPYVAPVTTTAAAAPASSSATSNTGSGLSSGMGTSGTSYTGDLTYFTPGMGACGQVSTESDKMVAISEKIFDSYLAQAGGNPNNNPLCGKYITITGTDGSPFQAQIYDRCPGCDEGSLDLPQAFFNSVTYNPATGASGDGRVHGVKWSFD